MKLTDVITKLKSLDQPILYNSDVSARLVLSRGHTSKIMSRLVEANFAVKITRGRWLIGDKVDRLLIPEYLTSPSPSYISLQTALFHHGLISQIPQTVYAVSISKTRTYKTSVGEFSIHHIDPEFFFGFETMTDQRLKIACPEKALLDVLYLSPGRSRLFANLPELDFKENFSFRRAKKMIERIPSKSRRALVSQKLDMLSSMAR
jgi:predicted transcriptional regulator of viral defense system